jgi:hypothetical protein
MYPLRGSNLGAYGHAVPVIDVLMICTPVHCSAALVSRSAVYSGRQNVPPLPSARHSTQLPTDFILYVTKNVRYKMHESKQLISFMVL